MGSIKEIMKKIKHIEVSLEKGDIFTVLIIILTAFGSFGLGRLSKIEESRKPLKIEAQVIRASVDPRKDIPAGGSNVRSGAYVASKNGNKYHYPWCSGAKRIKEENKIWFNSAEDAKKAGYTPAGNCKGL